MASDPQERVKMILQKRYCVWFTAGEMRDEIRPRADSLEYAQALDALVESGAAVKELRRATGGSKVWRYRDLLDRPSEPTVDDLRADPRSFVVEKGCGDG